MAYKNHWIPACAGMTTEVLVWLSCILTSLPWAGKDKDKAGMEIKEQRNKKRGNYGHAYRDVDGRAASGTSGRGIQPPSSFRRRPESSGLCYPFPPGGNDIRGSIRLVWHGQAEISSLLTLRPAFLDASFFWNDDEADMRKRAEEQKAWQCTTSPVIYGHAYRDVGRSASSAEPW